MENPSVGRRGLNARRVAKYSDFSPLNKKSYMSFRLVPISVTLNDLERRNGLYFALFHRIHVRCRRKTIVRLTMVSKSTFDSL